MTRSTNVIVKPAEKVRSSVATPATHSHREIVWLHPKETPKRIRSHRSLEAAIRKLKGKHTQTVANELRLAFDRFIRRGVFSINSTVFDYVHGCRARKQLMEVLSKFSVSVTSHSPKYQSKQRVFTLPGIKRATQKRPSYNGRGKVLDVDSEWVVWRMIHCEWMTARYQRWCQWCTDTGNEQHLDIDGRTNWGNATLDSLDRAEVPTNTAAKDPKSGQAHLDKLTKHGVLRMVYRRHGRMYHSLTNLAKPDRQRILLDGHKTAEVDMHACYWVILASWLKPEDRQQLIADLQSGDFYCVFEPLYDAFAKKKRAEMQAAGESPEQIDERLKGVKAEVQRQCLFSRDSRTGSRPLLAALETRYPALGKLIFGLRLKLGASGLSDRLQKEEGKLFVSTAIPAMHRSGVAVIGIHDGLLVPEKEAEETKLILERIAYRKLGFVPCVNIKSPPGNR